MADARNVKAYVENEHVDAMNLSMISVDKVALANFARAPRSSSRQPHTTFEYRRLHHATGLIFLFSLHLAAMARSSARPPSRSRSPPSRSRSPSSISQRRSVSPRSASRSPSRSRSRSRSASPPPRRSRARSRSVEARPRRNGRRSSPSGSARSSRGGGRRRPREGRSRSRSRGSSDGAPPVEITKVRLHLRGVCVETH